MFFDPTLENCRRIFIRNHRLDIEIGVYQSEKNRRQRVQLNVELWVPFAQCTPKNDSLEEVVDYDFVRIGIHGIVRRGHINLLETLCDAVAELCLAHPKVVATRVTAEKQEIYPDCECAGVEVFRIKERA